MGREEKIVELEKEIAVLKSQVENLKETNKELKQHYQELRDKHHELADNTSTHMGLSNLLHIFIPFLGVIGFVYNHLGKKNNEKQIKQISNKKTEEE